LVYALLSLNDNFDLESFAEKRQAALNALIAGAPRKAPLYVFIAPSFWRAMPQTFFSSALIEEFFKNQYSTDQRYVALNALATGARELASLPIPATKVPRERTSFPSKMLPGPLHRKYILAQKSDTQLVPLLMDEISRQALNNEQSDTNQFPEIIRERRLRLQKPHGITEVTPSHPLSQLQKPIHTPTTKFIDVAAEFFIMPFINQFWIFLRDGQMREERTAHNEGRGRYYGAGTGLILNPLVLSHVLRTLGILINASQNAPEWLAIIGPESLELAITIGTRPISLMESSNDREDGEEGQENEASVLTSALELALVVLSGSLEIDGGKILSLEHTTLILGVREWAIKVFSSLEKGIKVRGGGGLHEMKLSRAAAGVLLKSDELISKWGRSMLDMR
jgi:telomere length regulation protein